MQCKNCGAQLKPGVSYCGECGTKVENKTLCWNCGSVVAAGSKYCNNCGIALQAQQKKSGLSKEGEKRDPFKTTAILVGVLVVLQFFCTPPILAILPLAGLIIAILIHQGTLFNGSVKPRRIVIAITILLAALHLFRDSYVILDPIKNTIRSTLSLSESAYPDLATPSLKPSAPVVVPSTTPAVTPTIRPTPTAPPTPTPTPTYVPIVTKPERNGFDEETNIEETLGGVCFSVPGYWEATNKGESSYTAKVQEGGGGAILSLMTMDTEVPLTYDRMAKLVESGKAQEAAKSFGDIYFANLAEDDFTLYQNGPIRGYIWDCDYESEEDGLAGKSVFIVFPPKIYSSILIFAIYVEANSSYSYLSDFLQIIDSTTIAETDDAPTPTPFPSATPSSSPSPSPLPTPTEEPVSYSTNSKSTVKNGNSGVYSYVKSGSYDIYYIIDFDEGYTYYFCEGNGDTICDRVKIVEGDLNSVLIITYYESGVTWSYGLHFKWKNQPDHMILQDEDGFEYDFYTTNLSEALKLKNKKTIIDYSPP